MTVQRPYPAGQQPFPPRPQQPHQPQRQARPVAPARVQGSTHWYTPLSPTGGWPVLLPAVAAGRRRVWPWLLAVVVIVAAAAAAWVFWPVQAGQGRQAANTVPIGASYSYPSGLVVTVSDITAYTSTNPNVVSSGDTAYRGTVTLVNGSSASVSSAVMTIDVATGTHSDDRIFENAPPPTQHIAPGQQLAVPFAFTVVKQASGPLQVTVTAVPDHPAVFVGSTQ